MSLRRQLLGNVRWIVAIGVLVVGALLSLGYILSQQHLSFPWQDRYTIYAELRQANGLEAGLGQPVNVAGVRVGTIRGTELEDGRAVVELEIDPGELPRVYRDARAVLIPTTALKDLRIDLVPGRASAGVLPEGGRVPVARTTAPIDADELLSALDGDTREFVRVLLAEGHRATAGRGSDLRDLFRAIGPTAQQLQGVTRTLSRRRDGLERLVTNLARLSGSIGRRDADLAALVGSAGATVGALAREQEALDESLAALPGTLQAVRGTLKRTPAFTRAATGAVTALQPSIDRLPAALDAAAPLAREAGPAVRDDLRPLARDAQPAADDLRRIVPDLAAVTPSLSTAFRVVTYLVNELGHNPPGDDEGFLHHVAWALHNTNSVLTGDDANGPVVRSLPVVECDSVLHQPGLAPLAQLLVGTLPVCPQGEPR